MGTKKQGARGAPAPQVAAFGAAQQESRAHEHPLCHCGICCIGCWLAGSFIPSVPAHLEVHSQRQHLDLSLRKIPLQVSAFF